MRELIFAMLFAVTFWLAGVMVVDIHLDISP
jgi:hypothetical protein